MEKSTTSPKKPNKYTEPRLCKGPKPVNVPKNSTIPKEWAKNDWYINYTFNGKQYRIKEGINRIKDHQEKERAAIALLLSIQEDLRKGFNPENSVSFDTLATKVNCTIEDTVEMYLQELSIYARKSTVGDYQSKLRHLIDAHPKKETNGFTTEDLEKYIQSKIHPKKPAKMFMGNRIIVLKNPVPWTNKTVKSARAVFSAFFQWCIEKEYFKGDNPVSKIKAKLVRSEVTPNERHNPFTDEDKIKLMDYLNEKDKTLAFFCRVIYYTCLRPGEIAKLQTKDLDLKRGQITIPLYAAKNTIKKTTETIDIDTNLLGEIKGLMKEKYPEDYFLVSTSDTIIGADKFGEDRAYKRFVKALKALGLLNKGYTLYSFKHYSNIQRILNNWTINEVMVANRHSSLAMTDKYLKKINRLTDISKKAIPAI
jgi:integrase